MFWNNTSNVTNAFWAVLDSVAIITGFYITFQKWRTNKKNKENKTKKENAALVDKLEKRDSNDYLNLQLQEIHKSLDHKVGEIMTILNKVNYAIFNAGKTGLVNKVDTLIENQASIREDIAVLNSKTGATRERSRRE